MGVLDRVAPISETPVFIKLLLYGPPGTGKTTFAAQAPRPIFVDFEKSTDVLRYTPGSEYTSVIVPENVKELREIVRDVPSDERYDTLVLDSISQLQDFQLDNHMKEKFKGKLEVKERYLPLFQEFRISTEVMKEIFRELQAAPINVVLVAHDREYKESKTNADGQSVERTVAIGPDMTPRVNDSIRRLINIFAYYDKEVDLRGNVTRKLYVNPHQLIKAKNRLNIQETYLTNPKWSDLVKEPIK